MNLLYYKYILDSQDFAFLGDRNCNHLSFASFYGSGQANILNQIFLGSTFVLHGLSAYVIYSVLSQEGIYQGILNYIFLLFELSCLTSISFYYICKNRSHLVKSMKRCG